MSALVQTLKTSLNYFLIGVVAVVPLFVVVQIFYWLANFVLRTVFNIKQWTGHHWITATVFLAVYALLAYIGHELTKRRHSLILSVFDLVISRVPFFKSVYRVSQKVIDMFHGQLGERTREVVYVEYPNEGVWVPAYVTNRECDRYVLYVPTSPNPTNGYTVIVHESKVVKSELDFEEVTSFVVSVGADFPKRHEAMRLPR